MLIYLLSQSETYVLEVRGDETIKDIEDILVNEFNIQRSEFTLRFDSKIEIDDKTTLSEIFSSIDGCIIMDSASQNVKISNTNSDDENMKDTRVLLPPRTTYYYNQMFPNHNEEDKYHYDENKLYNDPPNMQELVESVLEIGVSQDTAVRALRLANYSFVDACLLIDEDSLGDGSLEASKTNIKLNQNSNNYFSSQIIRIPKEWLDQLSTREQAELTRLFKKYGIVEAIRDVYIATGYNEQIADNILSQYVK